MAASTVTRKQHNLSQKNCGGSPSGGIVAMLVATVPENQINKFVSIIKSIKGGSFPPDRDIYAISDDE